MNSNRKLQLNKETVRVLSSTEMAGVAGGFKVPATSLCPYTTTPKTMGPTDAFCVPTNYTRCCPVGK